MSHTSGVGRGYCYLLGSHIGNVDHYPLPIIAVISVVSLIQLGVELPRSRAARDQV